MSKELEFAIEIINKEIANNLISGRQNGVPENELELFNRGLTRATFLLKTINLEPVE